MKYVHWLSDTCPSTQTLHYLILQLQIPHTRGTFGGHEAAFALLLPWSLGTRCLLHSSPGTKCPPSLELGNKVPSLL